MNLKDAWIINKVDYEIVPKSEPQSEEFYYITSPGHYKYKLPMEEVEKILKLRESKGDRND